MDHNELALVDPPKRKGRGPSKPKTKPTEPFNVEFNRDGRAIGKHRNDWASYVGSMTRLRISILDDDWSKIKAEQKDALWEVIKEYFDLTDNDRKDSTLTQCNHAWKRFKTILKADFMIPNKKPYENKKYSFIEPEDWEKFCRKHRSSDNMKKRAIGKSYAKLQTNYARLGRSGYRGMDVDLSKVNMDEALKKEILDITCERTKRWILARITCPNMEEIFKKLVDADKKMVQGLIPKEKGADPLIVVLGPEHGGRTRTVGDGIGFRKGIVGYKQTKKRKKSIEEIEEIEAIVDRKLAQRDAERDAARDAERDAARDAERDAARDSARDAAREAELDAERDMEIEASNEGRLHKRRKQSSCESTTVSYQDKEKLKDIKEPKPCVLFSPYTEDTIPIARGMVYPIGNGTIHGGPLIPYYMKVSVDSFVPTFGDTKLPVLSKANETITLLQQSVGSFFQWPRCRISRILENTPTSKDKASQTKATTSEPTLATPTHVVQETTMLLPVQTPALLETQETEASSAEDAIKAKKELEKKLDNFEHDVFRKQPCVKDAYLRWTTRDDDTADYILEVPGGMIAGHEDTFHVPISTEDMLSLWKLDGLNISILLYFEWGLCKMLQSRNDNRCGFLNPYSIEGSLCIQPGSAVKDYLTHALSVSNYDFMLAPYAQEDHWVLFVICPKQRTGYILDSKNKKQTKTERTYWLTRHLQDAVGSYTWTMAKSNQQQSASHSGYYVMRWMYDFVNTYQLHFPKTIPWMYRRQLVENEIN